MPLPTTFNPTNANFQAFTNVGNQHLALAGLAAASAFGMAGVAALYTYGAAASGPIIYSGVTFQYGAETATVVYSSAGTGLSAGQVAGLASARALALGSVAPVTLAPMMTAFGFTRVGTVGQLIALGVYNNPTIYNFFGNIGGYLGGYFRLGGGFGGSGTPPGFPGFPANTVYGNFSGSPGGPTYGCIEVDGVQECFYYY